jgi:predicted lipase
LSKIIEITVGPKGETRVETKGFTGSECRDASRFVEQALGQRTAEQLTAEFYQGQQTGQDLRQSI